MILDVGLHTRGMTPAEGVSYAVEHLAVDREEAMEMVRRASARPTYALADAVGRRELLQSAGELAGAGRARTRRCGPFTTRCWPMVACRYR